MKIHELLTDESKWTKGAYAKDKDECHVMENTEGAVCWCLLGAINKCYGILEAKNIKGMVMRAVNSANLANYNDHPSTTFSEVRNLCLRLDI